MKIASCFLYVLCTLIYLQYGHDATVWYAFGQATILIFISTLGYFVLSNEPNTEEERLFLEFIIRLTGGRAVYTIYCLFKEDSIIIYNTDVFKMIACSAFLILLFNCAINKSPLK